MRTRQGPPVKHRRPRESNSRGLVVAGVVLAVVAAVLAGYLVWQQYGPAEQAQPKASPQPITVATSLPADPIPSAAAPPPLADDGLAASFEQLSTQVGAQIGLSYTPLGASGQARSFGTWSHGPAWSTSKVPLSLALLQQNGGEVTSAMRSAITASDNGSAESIWDELGGGAEAAAKMQKVLAAAGNPDTQVPSERLRAGFSIFGQTDWSLDDQARFLANVGCEASAAPVTNLMGQIVSGQQWGLGGINGAYFKGGWGPGTDGLYLVRQLGVIPTKTGQVAVAIAAVADSGGFGDGTAVLNRVADWLRDHLDQLGGGHCPAG